MPWQVHPRASASHLMKAFLYLEMAVLAPKDRSL
jgi:hypothetical protein